MPRIFYSDRSDPMVADTVHGLNALASQLQEFLSSNESELFIEGLASATPAPYDSFLLGIRFVKESGPVLVSIGPSGVLTVRGAVENLSVWCSHFSFPASATEGDHHHPENVMRAGYLAQGSLSVIIEVRGNGKNAL